MSSSLDRTLPHGMGKNPLGKISPRCDTKTKPRPSFDAHRSFTAKTVLGEERAVFGALRQHSPICGAAVVLTAKAARPAIAASRTSDSSRPRRWHQFDWVSNKWAGRAPDGSLLVRVFLGGDGAPVDVTREDDQTLAQLSLLELERLAGRLGEPRFTRVHRHIGSNSQPSHGHRDRLARIESTLRTLPGLHLAGAAYDGVSIADCVRQARRVAERITSA